jgi:hypothetical protein
MHFSDIRLQYAGKGPITWLDKHEVKLSETPRKTIPPCFKAFNKAKKTEIDSINRTLQSLQRNVISTRH